MHVTLANLGSRPLVALLVFTAWTVLLVTAVGLVRVLLVAKKSPTKIEPGVQHGPPAYWRLNRAHVNAVENLALFASIVLAGAALGVSSARLASLADVVVGARVVQSIAHVASADPRAIRLRFVAFATQQVCFLWMIAETIALV